jgi:Cd2+/Zn2+-exporting ATPase
MLHPRIWLEKRTVMQNNEYKDPEAGLEITSPRTAEQPGPQLPEEQDSCCAPTSKKAGAAPEADTCCTPKVKKRPVVMEEDGCCAPKPQPAAGEEQEAASYFPALISLVLLLSGLALDYFSVGWFAGVPRLAVYSVAYLLVGYKVMQHAVINIGRGQVFNEFFLMSIATLGAFAIGEYAEGVAVMLFYVIGEHFQEAAVARSRRSIKALIDNRPETVNLLLDGQVRRVHPGTVAIGETIQLLAGERVALDGEIVSRGSSFNTAALTGESKPDVKAKGEQVLAGMINLDKVTNLRVTAAYEDSALSKILRMVEDAGSRKAKTQQFITRFAKVYTPIVVFLALALALLPYFFVGNYVFSEWLYRALVFLVISCPCALVISIPLGYFGGIGAASKNGILFKGSNYLDLMSEIDTVVMDKTGTLTEGVFNVQQVQPVGIAKEQFLALVAALERNSTHPIAKAVVAYVGQAAEALPLADVEEIAGHGLRGRVAGKEVLVGNPRLLSAFGISYDPAVDALVETLVVVAIDGVYAGYITIADQLKEDARQAIQQLREVGVNTTVMLSGDKESIVQQVARELQIDRAFGGLLPQDKVKQVEVLQREGRKVAFVGDGINDAPVITMADVGIAMGALGSDAAIETADVVIQTGQPSRIATAIRLGRKTKQLVWQNIALAFGVKALVLAMGAFGVASLWGAVFADVGVAFLAILNAIRIQRMKF